MASRQGDKARAREERLQKEQQAAAAERRRRRFAYSGAAVLGAVVVGIVALALALGSDDGDDGGVAGAGSGGAEAGHIHGLGLDPADGSLLIATHNGLFRAPEGAKEAPRVGTSDRDLMGFSVVGPNHFVASGHPGSESELPANIGLTESRDGGETWEPVSLLGEADFHVLRASGERVYGYDGPNGRFMVSTNLGRDWTQRDVPAVPFDLAIDPDDADHLIVATDNGLHASRDAGRSWQRVSDQVALLAWGDPQRLFMLDQGGQVLLSRDAGRTTRAQGRVEAQPVNFMADENAVYVALADGTVLRSTDDGASFTVRATL